MTELILSLCNDCVARNQCGKDDVKMCASYTKETKIKCDDCKFVEDCVDYGWDGCKKFTPKPTEPMTNEEYIRQASTEELAKTVYEIAVTPKLMDRFFDAEVMNGKSGVEEALEWLKEKHTE